MFDPITATPSQLRKQNVELTKRYASLLTADPFGTDEQEAGIREGLALLGHEIGFNKRLLWTNYTLKGPLQ